MDTSMDAHAGARSTAQRSASAALVPLALAQFVATYAGTNMNVAVTSIAQSLNTTVHGVQVSISLFTLTMAALMIPGSKLTDIWGRKFCFLLGLIIYGLGAIIGALSPGLGVLIIGYSLFEGVGSALMIPPIYILVTVMFTDLPSRARSFGIISAAAGVGAAAGPLIGGIVTTAINWQASFILQALIVLAVIILATRIADPGVTGAVPRMDIGGAVLSALGLFFVVLGVLQSGTYTWFVAKQDFYIGNVLVIPQGGISPVWLFIAIGAILLAWFYLHIRRREQRGKDPLLSTRMFTSRTANLGLVTQLVQWLTLQGAFFVISVYLQTVHHFTAIQTGLMLLPAIIGLLLTSTFAGRLSKRWSQKLLIVAGFIGTIAGILLLLLLAQGTADALRFLPGLFLMGAGIGVMLTISVNVVQSAFPEKDQGEISGLSRSVSNLGSSFGTAIVGSILLVNLLQGNKTYGLALIVMATCALIGLIAAVLLPSRFQPAASPGSAGTKQEATT